MVPLRYGAATLLLLAAVEACAGSRRVHDHACIDPAPNGHCASPADAAAAIEAQFDGPCADLVSIDGPPEGADIVPAFVCCYPVTIDEGCAEASTGYERAL